MRFHPLLAVVAGVLAAPGLCRADLIQSSNVIVTGNLTTGAEIQGRTIVGGTLVAGNAENFAIGNGTTTPSSFNGSNSLVVGGNITGGNPANYKVMGGNVLVGGTISNNQISVNGGGTLTAGSASATTITGQAAAAITNLSTYYSGLATNSTVTSSTNGQPSGVVFTAAAGATNGVAVFNVNASLFSSQLSQSYNLVANGDTTFVINVIGSSANIDMGNFLSGFQNNDANIIFNFESATTVSTNEAIYGSILAPDATLTNQTAINGSVYVENFVQNGEVHLPTFSGFDPPAVPVPPTALLFGMGLPGGFLASRFFGRGRPQV